MSDELDSKAAVSEAERILSGKPVKGKDLPTHISHAIEKLRSSLTLKPEELVQTELPGFGEAHEEPEKNKFPEQTVPAYPKDEKQALQSALEDARTELNQVRDYYSRTGHGNIPDQERTVRDLEKKLKALDNKE